MSSWGFLQASTQCCNDPERPEQPHLLRGRVSYPTFAHLTFKTTPRTPLFAYWESPSFSIQNLLQRKPLHVKPSVHKSSKLHLKPCSGTWQGIRWFWGWTQAMRLQEGTTPTSCAVLDRPHHPGVFWEDKGRGNTSSCSSRTRRCRHPKAWRKAIRNKAALPIKYFHLDPPVLAPYRSFPGCVSREYVEISEHIPNY